MPQEGSEILPLGRKAATLPLIASMLFSACSGVETIKTSPDTSSTTVTSREEPHLSPTTIPTGLYPEEAVDLDGNVAITQDEVNECSTTNPKISEQLTEIRNEMDKIVDDMYSNFHNIKTIDDLEPILERIESVSGIKIIIPETDVFFNDYFNYDPISNDLEGARNVMSALESIIANMKGLPPEMLKIADINAIYLFKNLVDVNENGLKDIGGFWDNKSKNIVLDVGVTYGSEAMVHEFAHALDFVLCGQDDYYIDEEFSTYNTVEYLGSNSQALDDSLNGLNYNRVFSTKYGSSSVGEDRASMIEDLLYRRGIVQPGDPDWGSPYHHKQNILIRRLTEINPNFRDFLIEITDYAEQRGWRLQSPNFTPLMLPGQSETHSTDIKIDLATQEEVDDIEQELLKKIRNRETIPYYLTNEDSFIFIPNQENDSAGVVVFNPIIEPWVDDLMPQHMGTFSWFIKYSDRFQLESFSVGSRPVIKLGDGSMIFNESPIQIGNKEQANVPSGFENNIVMTDSLGNGVGVAIYVDDINSFLEKHGYHY